LEDQVPTTALPRFFKRRSSLAWMAAGCEVDSAGVLGRKVFGGEVFVHDGLPFITRELLSTPFVHRAEAQYWRHS
jgi:hypothetical protein